MTIDFDRALVIFDSQFGPKISELASGHTECCELVDEIPYLSCEISPRRVAKFPTWLACEGTNSVQPCL